MRPWLPAWAIHLLQRRELESKLPLAYRGKNEAGTPKEGSARVAIGNATGLTHVYTVECNYNASRLRNTVVSAPKEVGSPPNKDRDPQRLTIGHMESLGRSILVATLDLTFPNKRLTRLQWSEFRNLQVRSF